MIKTVKQLFNTVKKQMKIKEGWSMWEIAPKFDWQNLRENYVTGKIFNVNQLVENLNTGLVGKVIRRGTNYLICVTEDGMMFKSWIRDITEKKKVKRASETGIYVYLQTKERLEHQHREDMHSLWCLVKRK